MAQGKLSKKAHNPCLLGPASGSLIQYISPRLVVQPATREQRPRNVIYLFPAMAESHFLSSNKVSRHFITDLSSGNLEQLVSSLGEPGFRVRQLQRWLYQTNVSSFSEMTDLPRSLQEKLEREYRFSSLAPVKEIRSKDGQTQKVLFRLSDGKTIESVLLYFGRTEERRAVCLSSQVGCAIGCPFCATGQQGFERNLTPGEIIDQVLYFARRLRKEGEHREPSEPPVNNIVFMGMGEPLANYTAVWPAIKALNSAEGFGLGARRFTISTAGLVPQIKRLSRERLPVGLAISLLAPRNSLRNELVPLNKKYPVEELIAAVQEYTGRTGRRVSFEHVLFANINDDEEQAEELAQLLKDVKCQVNLIPANNAGDPRFRAPLREQVAAFRARLEHHGIATTVRLRRGTDIQAGCGQLRSRYNTIDTM